MFVITDGNITITNLETVHGYQLVDSDTDNYVVSFSSNNGPSSILLLVGKWII